MLFKGFFVQDYDMVKNIFIKALEYYKKWDKINSVYKNVKI